MNKQIKELANQSLPEFYLTNCPSALEKFAQLVAEHCAQLCGSQADKRNIRHAFGISVASDVKYPAPEALGSVTSQYQREYNIPRGSLHKE